MQFTHSYNGVFPATVLDRYDMVEVRNAAAMLQASNPTELADIIELLESFELTDSDFAAGGNRSDVATRLDEAMRAKGWREGQVNTAVTTHIKLMPWKRSVPRERRARTNSHTETNLSYKVDNLKGRVAFDVEWNAKDGNLDRDLTAYRAFHELGQIDVGVILTRRQRGLRAFAAKRGRDIFSTTTTTNLDKLEPRLTRGDAAGCPVLAIGITERTHEDYQGGHTAYTSPDANAPSTAGLPPDATDPTSQRGATS